MINFFADNFANSVALAVLIMSMIPSLESKVAIPFGMSVAIWGEQALSPVVAFFVALFGSLIPSLLVICFARFIKRKTTGFIYEKFVSKYNKNIAKIQSKGSTLKKCLTLATFVAIPLPLTGVYTGSLIGGFLNLKFWQIFLSVTLGACISCGVVLLLCMVFENSTFYIFMASLIIVALWLIASLILTIIKRSKKN